MVGNLDKVLFSGYFVACQFDGWLLPWVSFSYKIQDYLSVILILMEI